VGKKHYRLLKPKIVSPMETPEKAADMAAFASVLYHEPDVIAAGAKAAGLTAAIDEELKLSKDDMILLSNSCKGKLSDPKQKSLCEKLKKKHKKGKKASPKKKAKALKNKANQEKKKAKAEAKKAARLKNKAKKVAKKAVAKKSQGKNKKAKKLKKKATNLAKKSKNQKKKSKKDLKKAKKDKKKAKKVANKDDAAMMEIFAMPKDTSFPENFHADEPADLDEDEDNVFLSVPLLL